MSIFPTKILLATDGSSEARLAARTAVDLAQKTGSELHAVHVVDAASGVPCSTRRRYESRLREGRIEVRLP